jgi:hypothetical protein
MPDAYKCLPCTSLAEVQHLSGKCVLLKTDLHSRYVRITCNSWDRLSFNISVGIRQWKTFGAWIVVERVTCNSEG